MIGYIVTGHAQFATGVTSAAELIAGKQDHLVACNFDDFSNADSIYYKLQDAVNELSDCEEIVVFCDLLSGSPYNKAIQLKVDTGNTHMHIVYGINLALLIEAFTARGNDSSLEEILAIPDMAKFFMGVVADAPAADEDDDF